MITKEKIEIYIKCDGNGDSFAQIGTQEKKRNILKDWKFLDDLVFDLIMIKKGVASKEMRDRVEKEIEKNFEGEESKELLFTFVRNQTK